MDEEFYFNYFSNHINRKQNIKQIECENKGFFVSNDIPNETISVELRNTNQNRKISNDIVFFVFSFQLWLQTEQSPVKCIFLNLILCIFLVSTNFICSNGAICIISSHCKYE